MVKKLFLIICFFIFTFRVNAARVSNVEPTKFLVDGKETTVQNFSADGFGFFGKKDTSVGGSSQRFQYSYDFSFLPSSGSYDVTFVVRDIRAREFFDTQSGQTNYIGIGVTTLFTTREGVCTLDNTSHNASMIYSVTCKDVKKTNDFSLVAVSSYGPNFETGYTLRVEFGLMSMVYYSSSELNGVQSIIDNQNENAEKQLEESKKQTEEQKKQTEEQKKQTDFITSNEAPDTDVGALGNVQGLLPPGPADSLLNIPFKFLSIVTSSFGGVCKPIKTGIWNNVDVVIPCFSELIYANVPDWLMIYMDVIPAGFILITYLKYFYKKIERAQSLETNSNDEWGVL